MSRNHPSLSPKHAGIGHRACSGLGAAEGSANREPNIECALLEGQGPAPKAIGIGVAVGGERRTGLLSRRGNIAADVGHEGSAVGRGDDLQAAALLGQRPVGQIAPVGGAAVGTGDDAAEGSSVPPIPLGTTAEKQDWDDEQSAHGREQTTNAAGSKLNASAARCESTFPAEFANTALQCTRPAGHQKAAGWLAKEHRAEAYGVPFGWFDGGGAK